MAEKHHEAIFQHRGRTTAWRAIEFFAGIGGFACAWPEVDIAAAIDIDSTARDIYQQNWPHPYLVSEITSLTVATLQRLDANLWWLSPPCQPYSRRGRQRDVDDPRSAALLHLISLLPELRPRGLVLENVIGFRNSRARSLLQETLHGCGYNVVSRELCPTELDWPNRRPRFYLIACRESLADWRPLPQYALTLDNLLRDSAGDQALDEAIDEDACRISAEHQSLYGSALDRVERSDRDAVTACFGSSYGKSLLHAGSYLIAQDRWRRFAPREVAGLLGYPATFAIPAELSYRRAWKLLGNSLSIPAVRYILSHLP